MEGDDFYLAWLARECRFSVSIHFAQRNLLGYRLVRIITVTPQREPAMMEWLAGKDIHTRIIKDPDVQRRLLRLLRPVSKHVRDRDRMVLLLSVIAIPLKGMKHEDLFGLSGDSCVLSRYKNQIIVS